MFDASLTALALRFLARQRGASDLITTPAGIVRVASVVDLLRIADASPSKSAYREALAYQALLDVIEARRRSRPPDDRSPAEKIDAALRGGRYR